MNKTSLNVILFSFICLLLCACEAEGSAPINLMKESPEDIIQGRIAPESVISMSPPPINSDNWVTVDGGIVFYSSETGLFKMDIDGATIKIATDHAIDLYVTDDALYYYSLADGNYYRICLDDSEKEMIPIDSYAEKPFFINNWIYFNSNEGIYRYDKAGRVKELVIKGSWRLLSAADEWLICVSRFGEVSKFYLDGSNETLIFKKDINSIIMEGDWIYYVETNKGDKITGSLYKIKSDGSNLTNYNVPNEKINWIEESIWINDGWVYHAPSEVKSDLWRINPDRLTTEMVTQGQITSVDFADDWIFYYDITPDNAWAYRMKLDGTQKTKLFPLNLGC